MSHQFYGVLTHLELINSKLINLELILLAIISHLFSVNVTLIC